jgi:hypothetical protein
MEKMRMAQEVKTPKTSIKATQYKTVKTEKVTSSTYRFDPSSPTYIIPSSAR